ncbi:hypothetical protein PS623_03978 [Pseudomonas fluorescens]|nr:hypothetical protein PS623_03978 [Pseudomonas fluorescens]
MLTAAARLQVEFFGLSGILHQHQIVLSLQLDVSAKQQRAGLVQIALEQFHFIEAFKPGAALRQLLGKALQVLTHRLLRRHLCGNRQTPSEVAQGGEQLFVATVHQQAQQNSLLAQQAAQKTCP